MFQVSNLKSASTNLKPTSTNQPIFFCPLPNGKKKQWKNRGTSSHLGLLCWLLAGVALPEECQHVDSDLSSLMPLIGSADPSELMIPGHVVTGDGG